MKSDHAGIEATLTLLCERFPRAFFRLESRRVPLKIGIHHDLEAALAGEVETMRLRRTLGIYTGNYGYLRAQQVGVARVDLNGEKAGEVAAKDAEHAAKILKKRTERWKQQKQQKVAAPAKQQIEPQKPDAMAKPAEKPPQPPADAPAPRRDGLAALREAGLRRRA